jgi:hypothetical protein
VLASDAKQIILLCSRQSGKSTVTSILATHQAVAVPGSLVLLLAPALRQSQELFRKVKGVYAALGDTVPAVVENALSLELANASRIVCLPGQEMTVRGFSAPDLVIEDEASRVTDALHQAIRPMLAISRGRLVLLSSPFGRRGHMGARTGGASRSPPTTCRASTRPGSPPNARRSARGGSSRNTSASSRTPSTPSSAAKTSRPPSTRA